MRASETGVACRASAQLEQLRRLLSQKNPFRVTLLRSPPVSLHLVDPSDGRSVQTWTCEGDVITIGRGEDVNIRLADPFVSRLHAELHRSEGTWRLRSLGMNGVFIDGRSIDDCGIETGSVFRLGAQGPMFRFEGALSRRNQSTLVFDSSSMIVLALNRAEVEAQAQDIAETDYFRQLQGKARELRRQRQRPSE